MKDQIVHVKYRFNSEQEVEFVKSKPGWHCKWIVNVVRNKRTTEYNSSKGPSMALARFYLVLSRPKPRSNQQK